MKKFLITLIMFAGISTQAFDEELSYDKSDKEFKFSDFLI